MEMSKVIREYHESVLAQLRHAYAQLAAGTVRDQRMFADGLIAPAIRALEQEPMAWIAEYDGHTATTTDPDTMREWRDRFGRKITPLYR